MLELLRKHQHGIMIVVAFVVIIAFAWFFNPYDARSGSLNELDAFTLGKKSVSFKEVQRQQRILQAANTLGFSFTMQLLQPTFDVVDFTQNRLVLRQEARKLGIEPSEDEVLKAIGNHPSFQTSGKFDQSRYDDAIANDLQPAGLQPGDLRALVADKLTMEKVDALLGSNSSAPSSLVDLQFQRDHEKISASVIDLKLADYEAKVEVTDEKLKEFYETQKDLLPAEEQRRDQSKLNDDESSAVELLLSDEKREVEFVFFEQPIAPAQPAGIQLPNDQPPFPGASGVQSFEIPNPNAGGGTPPSFNITPGADPGALDIPQIEVPAEVPPVDTEAEPPGQAPEPLEGSTELQTEPLPAPPVDDDLDNLDAELTPPDQLQGDVNVGGLTEEIPPSIPGEDTSLTTPDNPLSAQPAPMLDNLPMTTPEDATASASIDAEAHKEKMAAYEKRVDDFYTALFEAPNQFQALAENEGVELKKSGLFVQDDRPASPRMPDELVTAIFKAQADNDQGVMVPVEALNPQGFYVVRIIKVEEPKELTFDEAKAALTKAFTKKEAQAKLKEAAEEVREKLIAALAAGTSFADAAKANDLTVREIPEFTLTKRPSAEVEANATELVEAVGGTTTGSVSKVTQAGDDVMLVCVTQRVAAPEVKADAPDVPVSPGQDPVVDPEAEKTKLAERLDQQARRSVFGLWLANRREAVGVKRNPQIDPIIYFPYGNRNFGF